jgi:hypothetical protein
MVEILSFTGDASFLTDPRAGALIQVKEDARHDPIPMPLQYDSGMDLWKTQKQATDFPYLDIIQE